MSKELKLWIARDNNGPLYFHKYRPKLDREKGIFVSGITGRSFVMGTFDSTLFPQVTLENSPKKCKLIIEE